MKLIVSILTLASFIAHAEYGKSQATPTAVKTWKTAEGILKNKCYACHGGAGDESADPNVNNTKSLKEYSGELVERVIDDADMPPTKFKAKFERKYQVTAEGLTHMQLSKEERMVLKDWLDKGMPALPNFSKEPVKIQVVQKAIPVKEKEASTKYESLSNDEVETRIVKLFDNKCTQCHVSRTSASSSDSRQKGSHQWRGVDFMKDLKRLFDKNEKIHETDLWYTLKTDMPPENAKNGTWKGDEWNLVVEWMKRDCPVTKSTVEPLKIETVYQAVLNDLQQVVEHRRKYIRYFTLTNLYNTPGEARNMDLYRLALAKLINSLSTGSRLVAPEVIAGTKETVYKVDIRDLKWTETLWDELMVYYPYEFRDIRGALSLINSLLNKKNIIVRADWFTMVASQPPFYGKFLKQPNNQEDFEDYLHVDRKGNIRDGQVIRAGFSRSGVSAQNRLIERHESDEGYYWISYDFKTNDGKGDLLENPLGPSDVFTGKKVFDHDGGEMVYSLPNGLNGYYLATADGKPINVGPTDIVFDRSNRRGGVIVNGISCISCHDQGIKSAKDEIRSFVRSNPGNYPQRERHTIEELYPRKAIIQEALKEDRQSFQSAVKKLAEKLFRKSENAAARTAEVLKGIGVIDGDTEPIEPVRLLFERYLDHVDLDYAASAFHLSAEEFESYSRGSSLYRLTQRLKKSGVARDRFNEDLAYIAAQMGKHVREVPKLDLPIFTHGDLNNPTLSFRGIDDLVSDLSKNFLHRYKNVALGSFQSAIPSHKGVSALSVDFRSQLGHRIKKDKRLNLAREDSITDIDDVLSAYSSETGVDFVKLGVDYVVGGTYTFDGHCGLKLFIKVIDVRSGRIHQLNKLIQVWQKGKATKLPTSLVYPR